VTAANTVPPLTPCHTPKSTKDSKCGTCHLSRAGNKDGRIHEYGHPITVAVPTGGLHPHNLLANILHPRQKPHRSIVADDPRRNSLLAWPDVQSQQMFQ